MNKKNYLWWALGVVAVVLFIYLLATLTTPNTTTVAPAPAATKSTNNAGLTNSGIPATGQVTPTTTATGTIDNTPPVTPHQPIKAEFMTDKEKTALNISPSAKVQVLQRSASGTITAYKIINKDSDILTSF
jgi:K+-transporting ATPase KdpF subunit